MNIHRRRRSAVVCFFHLSLSLHIFPPYRTHNNNFYRLLYVETYLDYGGVGQEPLIGGDDVRLFLSSARRCGPQTVPGRCRISSPAPLPNFPAAVLKLFSGCQTWIFRGAFFGFGGGKIRSRESMWIPSRQQRAI